MEEVKDAPVPQAEVGEIQTAAADEIVALFCSYKDADRTGDDQVEMSKGDQPFFFLRAGQFKKMARHVAQWYVGKASRWDNTQPLQITIKSLADIDALKAETQAKKHAKADEDARAAKAAKEAQEKLEAAAAEKAKLRRSLLDKALGAGVIKKSEEADSMTNEDLTDLLAK